MPDLLAHAFLAYTLGRLLSVRYAWLSPAYTTVVMVGAFVPDLAKAELVISSGTVAQLVGLPFDWFAFHTAGGVLVAIAVGVLVVAPSERRRTAALLGLGATSHLLADGLLLTASGRSYPMFWPLTRYHPPTPGLYLSTQPAPTIVTGLVAALVWGVTRDR